MTTRTKKMLLMIIGLWLAAIAAFTIPNLVAVGKETKSVEHLFSSYTDALMKGDYGGAYEFSGPDFRSLLSAAQFSEQQSQLQSRFGKLLSVKRQGIKVSRTGEPPFWSAQIAADMDYANASRRFEFSFRKHTGKWVLYGYQETGPVNGQ